MALQITESEFRFSISKAEDLEEVFKKIKPAPSFVFSGRSNSGKSTLLNRVTGQNISRVSKTPGRTQSILFFASKLQIPPKKKVHEFWIIDLPGYGYAKVPEVQRVAWGNLIEHFFETYGYLSGHVLVSDIRRGLQDLDTQMIQYVGDSVETRVAFTKFDRLKNQKDKALAKQNVDRAIEIIPSLSTVISGTHSPEGPKNILHWMKEILISDETGVSSF